MVSVILLAPYSQLQSYSCIVNFVRKMKQPAWSFGAGHLSPKEKKYVLALQGLEEVPLLPKFVMFITYFFPFFLRPCLAEWVENRTGQAAAKVHFDILVRTVTSSSLEYNAAASSGASASIGSERSSTSVCN